MILNTNGLDITEEQFMQMKAKEQNLILFRNMVFIRKQFKDYKITKKIQYAWLFVLTMAVTTFYGVKNFVGL